MNEDAWYVVELKGFRVRAGQMREVVWAGVNWVRIDLPLPDGGWDMEHVHPESIYRFRLVDEDEARSIAHGVWQRGQSGGSA